jgi:hypothetical protein
MCDAKYRKLNQEYQELLLKQIRVLANEIKAWRSTSTSSQRWSLEEFMRSTDFSGWQQSLERGPLPFPNFIKRFKEKFLDLFKW